MDSFAFRVVFEKHAYLTSEDPRNIHNTAWNNSVCVLGMAKFAVRRYSDPFYVLALKEAIVKISAQKQCPNEGRIVRSVLQEFEWSKAEIIKQLKLAVKDGLILQVTTFSSHGSTKGIPQTAYRILRKDGEDDVSRKFASCARTRALFCRTGSGWPPMLDGLQLFMYY